MARRLTVIVIPLIFLASICLQSRASELSRLDDWGVEVRITPFDARYQRVQDHLRASELVTSEFWTPGPGGEPFKALKALMRMASRFKYVPDGSVDGCQERGHVGFSHHQTGPCADHWQLPEETQAKNAGDCEDRAIWLYVRLVEEGFTNLRLVVGKYRIDHSDYHAWVVICLDGTTYILDPTTSSGIWEAEQYPSDFYIPLYSYHKDTRWQHE